MRRTLAEIVVEEKLVDPERLAVAERQARRSGEPLIVALVELEQVPELALVGAMRRHLRFPVVEVGDGASEADAIREVPHELARRRRLLPLALEVPAEGARTLRLAMADPTDLDAIAEVEISTGCRVEPVIAPLSAIDHAIAGAYRGMVTAVMKKDTVPPRPPPRRVPFGGDLVVATPAMSPEEARTVGLSTEPLHRLEDEVPIEQRHRALVDLLVKKGVITPEEYHAEIRKVLKADE